MSSILHGLVGYKRCEKNKLENCQNARPFWQF